MDVKSVVPSYWNWVIRKGVWLLHIRILARIPSSWALNFSYLVRLCILRFNKLWLQLLFSFLPREQKQNRQIFSLSFSFKCKNIWPQLKLFKDFFFGMHLIFWFLNFWHQQTDDAKNNPWIIVLFISTTKYILYDVKRYHMWVLTSATWLHYQAHSGHFLI